MTIWILLLSALIFAQTPQEEAFLELVRSENGSIAFANESLAAKFAERYPDLAHRRSPDFDVLWSENSPFFVEADLDSDGKKELLAFFEVKTGRSLRKAVAAFRGNEQRWAARDVLLHPSIDYEYASSDEKGVVCREKSLGGGMDTEVVERLRRLRMNDDYLIVTSP